MAETIIGETKREGKERPKDVQLARNKKKEKASPSCGRKLSHPRPF
jgi:hypothetical protein